MPIYVIKLNLYVMKKKLLLFIMLLCTFFVQQKANAQITLAAGDIAFIGYNTGPLDGFSFITLKAIPAGTIIYFTDRGWGNGTWVTGSTEPHLKWTVPSLTPIGTIVSFMETSTPETFTITGTTGIGFAPGYANFNLNSGDQMLAYQSATGTAEPILPNLPTFIAGINGDYNSSDYDSATTWNLPGTSGGNGSALPLGLTNGVNCVSLFPGTTEIANSKFNGILTGSASVIRASINNYANWSHDPSVNYAITPSDYPTPAITAAVAPTVTTTPASNVKSVSATIGGNVSNDGGDASITRGIVWATTPNPVLVTNTSFAIGTGTGTFTGTVTGLTPGSLIYYRAYATNSGGTNYGAELTLTTTAALSTSSTSKTDVSCFAGTNGTATVAAIGGSGAGTYTYSWSPSGGTGATASGLSAGTYTATITDAESTSITRVLTVGQPVAALNGTPSTTAVSCFGGANGTATITPSGGTSTYTYLWSNGATTATATGLASGTYSVTITDANSCTKLVTGISVGSPAAAVNGTATTTPVSCFGGTNGTATVTATGGTGPGTYTYSWSPTGGNAATATGLASGTYSVTITDANSCTKLVTGISVGSPATAVDGTATSTPVSCFGGSNGSATVIATGGTGTGTYTYSWAPSGGTAATATGLTAGTYSVTITDANSCFKTVTGITVGSPAAALDGTTSTTSVSCNGGANGTATVVATGGTSTYTYLWSNGSTSATATGLLAGTYTVTITDANSCSKLITGILVTQPPAIAANPSQVNVSCNGGANGSATVAPTGGTGTKTYLWSNGATTSSITGLSIGTYSVTITDANLCPKIQSFTITQPPILVAAQGTINNVSCNGGTNGSATVTASGGTGTGTYTYSWAPTGGTASTASGLAAGTYTVTVTDANACQTTQSFTITEPSVFAVTPSQNNILCKGTATGSATVNVTGAAGNYTYSWSPSGGTAATASGLTAGTYTVTITDANTCQTTQSFTITEPATALTATPGAINNINCRGEATGSATVNVTGGTGTYTYSWAPSGGTAATASGLAAGTYTVTVTDASLCQTTQSFTITQPAAILSASTASTGVSCFGGSNGTASVTVSGGTPGYTYAWAPLGGITSSITGRPAGNYTCTITDNKGCTLVKNITINTPAAFSASIVKTDVSCNGGTNGSATVTATGATFPYTYSWSPTGGTSATASGLQAGTYTVTISDANTCSYTASVTIDQPALLTATSSQTNVLCNGGATGTASVIATGGNGTYTYIWSPSGGTADTATGLSAGNYSCLITDSNGCILTKAFTITEPSLLSATQSQINATCSTGGQAAVSVSGGAGSYTYLWSNGGTAAIATGLIAGNYSVLITDANGCTLSKNFVITTTNTLVAVTSQTNVLCNGSSTGSATVVPSGAPGPFTYVWSPSGGNAATASNLAAGNYSVTLTSANGCSIVKNFTITEPSALVITPSQTNLSCNGGSNGSASVTVTGGTGTYTYSWAPSGGIAATASGLSAGTYTVTITDGNLCQTTQSFTITQPAALIATSTQTNVSCNGGNNGSATVNVTGGTGTYTYSWAPTGGTAATATGLAPGTYIVTVEDANLCQTTTSVTITEPAVITAVASHTNVSCNGSNDGTASVNVSGGTGTYTYVWAPTGGTSATATGLPAGNYTVTITDANSCTLTQTIVITTTPDITAPVPTVAILPEITNYCAVLSSQITIPTALDNCVGTVTATTTDPLNYNAVGTYVINWKYTDAIGNSTTQPQTVKVLASPINVVTFANAEFTFDGNSHAIQVANLPSGANVAYSISPSASSSNAAINAGIYTVTAIVTPAVSNANCSPITLTAQLTIKKAVQQITFGPLAAKILGVNNNFNLDAVANSGLPVRYSFTYTSALPPASVSATGVVNLLRSGSLLIVAHQDGNDNYLPAADVSQLLVIKNNDVTVTEIKIGTKSYPNPAKDIKYLMECGENNVNISIANQTGATITPSANFTITPPKPGIYTQNVSVTSQDGSTSANYTLTVEKPFGFYDIVKVKFNNVLLVNNNPLTNGGYEFVSYQWFKNGVQVGTGQYYTAGDNLSNTLDLTGDYSVKMTTKDGKTLQTCSAKITTQKSIAAKLYPNPIQTGKVITVEADFPEEELENMVISLYSVSGQLVKTLKSSTVKTEIQLPDAESNMYIVVLETANIKKTLKVIVNK
jgi:hypothetical protein